MQIIQINRELVETLCRKIINLNISKPAPMFNKELREAQNLANQVLESVSMGVLQ